MPERADIMVEFQYHGLYAIAARGKTQCGNVICIHSYLSSYHIPHLEHPRTDTDTHSFTGGIHREKRNKTEMQRYTPTHTQRHMQHKYVSKQRYIR